MAEGTRRLRKDDGRCNAGGEESGFLNDRCFLGILSSKEQKYVTETIFAEPDVMKSMVPSHAVHRAKSAPSETYSMMKNATYTYTPLPNARKAKGLPGLMSNGQSPAMREPRIMTPSFAQTSVKHVPDRKETPMALTAALDRLTAALNADGTLPLSTFETIVKELSGIECLQTMLLFRPNKKKGKGGRQPAKDPRLDPNMDPRKAKRIVANRKSAARSKQKQKRHVESLQLQHDTLMIQMLLCGREKEKLDNDIHALEHDTRVLETELQALVEHVQRVQSFVSNLTQERDNLRSTVEVRDSQKPSP